MAHDVEVECSNKGTCDRVTGECVCTEGFYGGACEYMACGGGLENPCNGHGQCKSMMELALLANDNGDATDFTYGADPNNYDTWDGHRIHGCYCDDGYEGYDCSLRTCPSGDDPATYDQSDEIQLFVCTATSGSFKLKFRQAETEDLPFDITVPELQNYLNDLSSLKDGIAKATPNKPAITIAAGQVIHKPEPKYKNIHPAVYEPTAYIPTCPTVTCPQNPFTIFSPAATTMLIQIKLAKCDWYKSVKNKDGTSIKNKKAIIKPRKGYCLIISLNLSIFIASRLKNER